MSTRRSIGGDRRDSGQAIVEAALVMPLYLFMILGLLQLSLMHQARLLTKYAAYKAVRAGALGNADVETMEKAALAVLLPIVSQGSSGTERILLAGTPTQYARKWFTELEVRLNRHLDYPWLKVAEVTICGPLKSEVGAGDEIDFDDPTVSAGSSPQQSNRTKLRIQLTFGYRLPIPFVNGVIHAMTFHREVSSVLLMEGSEVGGGWLNAFALAHGDTGYVIPIRANYALRMQSNIFTQNLPGSSECKFY